MPDAPNIPEDALCITCGYALRNLSNPRCPECGREFDPANSRSMNLGKKPGWILNFLLRPKRRWPMAATIIATLLVISASRWPRGGVTMRVMDLQYYFSSTSILYRLLSYTDAAYVGGLILMVVVFTTWIIGVPLRGILRKAFRQQPPPPVNLGRRVILATIAIAAMSGSILISWPYRIARAWIRQVMENWGPGGANLWSTPAVVPPPIALSNEQLVEVFRAAVMQLPSGQERLTGLKMLIEEHSDIGLPILLEAVRRESDFTILEAELRLVGLFGDPSALPTLAEFWDHPEPEIRAAATDGLGIMRTVGKYSNPGPDFHFAFQTETTTSPPVNYRSPFLKLPLASTDDDNDRPPSETELLRPKVEQRIREGKTSVEREAAARALLNWQQDYKLRVAEWGVWINVQGELKLVQSINDEIPPFVHRTGNSVQSIEVGINFPQPTFNFAPMIVTKPVLHLHTDRLMAIDVQILITDGRPWFAYPEPDDFTVEAEGHQARYVVSGSNEYPALKCFDSPSIAPLPSPREGYPGLSPMHRYAPDPGLAPQVSQIRDPIKSLGLRWQSVIVSPEKLSWMTPPDVPNDERFAWWNRLRQVPCAWVSNRGEAERFLYYDGPTRAPTPVLAELTGSILTTATSTSGLVYTRNKLNFESLSSFEPSPHTASDWPTHCGMFVRVDVNSRQPSGCVVESLGKLDLSTVPMMEGDALVKRFHQLLTEAGLTDTEAAGLVDCWRGQFLNTPGSRFILLMSSTDYDLLCPIRIDPKPTELVRVGLVLSEFGVCPNIRRS
jgi:hypothetical protein